jgi:hypothetical protein
LAPAISPAPGPAICDSFYLTNIQGKSLDPKQVRQWTDDLWMFPYYLDTRFVPYDARPGGAAAVNSARDEAAQRPNPPVEGE